MTDSTTLSFRYNIPDSLVGVVDVDQPYQNYDARGNPSSFGIDLVLKELHLHKTIKSREFHLLRGKLEDTFRVWDGKYQRHLAKMHSENRAAHVSTLNKEADELLQKLDGLLAHTLDVDDTVDWDAIKRKDSFRIKPFELFEDNSTPVFLEFTAHGRPTKFEPQSRPQKPTLQLVKDRHGFFTQLFFGSKIQQEFEAELEKWDNKVRECEVEDQRRQKELDSAIENFTLKKEEFQKEKERDNEALDAVRDRYLQQDAGAIEEYCDLVLTASEYPDFFPQNWQLEYRPQSRIVVVEYDLPPPDQLPTTVSYQYVKSRDEVVEKQLPIAAQKKLYESVIYQLCIRTIHELFEADVVDALDAVAFNGLVTANNPATGISETKTIMSIMSNKSEFMTFDLALIDPKATFKHLKGVSATKLIDLAPIPPVIQLDKSDKRFIEGRSVVDAIDNTVNLAAMDWDDFEHLVRELFEKEFSSNGGEVHVTQASSDGGVDAIAFDPDPIRGGKIVIQAKRYTNTVGVAAVRDLYGTVLNEGASKGILVTTSDYGKDSYEFAKGKPLTLLNGNNLLALLEQHGNKARINITEARSMRES